MRALRLDDGALSVAEMPMPEAGDEALIRVRLSGICGTDLELERGYYPFRGVIGHEFVGEVVSAPEPGWTGQRVVGEINVACGRCAPCRRGHPTHCERRSVLGIVDRDGCHAEYTRLPVRNLHRVPDRVSDDAAVFTEPLAAAARILEQVPMGAGDRVLLVGAGRLGQLVARVLALTGADLSVSARHDHQRALLAAAGIRTIDPAAIPAHGFDIVVEATGSPSGLDTAREALRPLGTLVLKSTYRGSTSIDLSGYVVDEITIVGSRCGPFDTALRLLERGEVDPTPLISHRLPLERGVEGMRLAAAPGVLKVLLDPTAG